MNRLEDDKNQLIVRTIQDALFEAKTSINSFELPEKNGIGLFSLNFIFKMIRKNCKELFDVFSFQRGPFKFVFLYEKNSKSIITFTSKNNAKNLSHRKMVKHIHYNDAFVLFNDGLIVEPTQMCIFEPKDQSALDKRRIYDSIMNVIGQLEVRQHIMICYDIIAKDYRLVGIESIIYSEHYYLIEKRSLNKFIEIDNEPEYVPSKKENVNTEQEKKTKNKFGISAKKRSISKKDGTNKDQANQ